MSSLITGASAGLSSQVLYPRCLVKDEAGVSLPGSSTDTDTRKNNFLLSIPNVVICGQWEENICSFGFTHCKVIWFCTSAKQQRKKLWAFDKAFSFAIEFNCVFLKRQVEPTSSGVTTQPTPTHHRKEMANSTFQNTAGQPSKRCAKANTLAFTFPLFTPALQVYCVNLLRQKKVLWERHFPWVINHRLTAKTWLPWVKRRDVFYVYYAFASIASTATLSNLLLAHSKKKVHKTNSQPTLKQVKGNLLLLRELHFFLAFGRKFIEF